MTLKKPTYQELADEVDRTFDGLVENLEFLSHEFENDNYEDSVIIEQAAKVNEYWEQYRIALGAAREHDEHEWKRNGNNERGSDGL